MWKYLNVEFICIKGLCVSGWWKIDLLKLFIYFCVFINVNLLFVSFYKMILRLK